MVVVLDSSCSTGGCGGSTPAAVALHKRLGHKVQLEQSVFLPLRYTPHARGSRCRCSTWVLKAASVAERVRQAESGKVSLPIKILLPVAAVRGRLEHRSQSRAGRCRFIGRRPVKHHRVQELRAEALERRWLLACSVVVKVIRKLTSMGYSQYLTVRMLAPSVCAILCARGIIYITDGQTWAARTIVCRGSMRVM